MNQTNAAQSYSKSYCSINDSDTSKYFRRRKLQMNQTNVAQSYSKSYHSINYSDTSKYFWTNARKSDAITFIIDFNANL